MDIYHDISEKFLRGETDEVLNVSDLNFDGRGYYFSRIVPSDNYISPLFPGVISRTIEGLNNLKFFFPGLDVASFRSHGKAVHQTAPVTPSPLSGRRGVTLEARVAALIRIPDHGKLIDITNIDVAGKGYMTITSGKLENNEYFVNPEIPLIVTRDKTKLRYLANIFPDFREEDIRNFRPHISKPAKYQIIKRIEEMKEDDILDISSLDEFGRGARLRKTIPVGYYVSIEHPLIVTKDPSKLALLPKFLDYVDQEFINSFSLNTQLRR